MTTRSLTSTDNEEVAVAWAARHASKTSDQIAQERYTSTLEALSSSYNSTLVSAAITAYNNASPDVQAAALAILGVDPSTI